MRSTVGGIRIAVVALLGFLAGCGLFGGEDEKSITISIDDDAVIVPQGSRDSVIVTLTRSRFDGPVELTVDGVLPAGVSVTYLPRTIPTGSTTSRVRFIATGGVNPGTFSVTLRATGEGVAEKAVAIEVTVTLTGSFSLGVLGPVTVAQGGGGSATILLPRTDGNASSVDLSVSGMPSGLTATFAQTPNTERGVTLAITAAAGVAAGNHTLTITGAAAGFSPNPTTQLTVTVIAPPTTDAVSIPFCSNSIPMWFAYQNEGFGWQRITATGNAFNFAATQKVAIAFVQQFGTDLQTSVYFATRNELMAMTDRDCDGVKTLTGSATPLTAGQTAVIVMGANAAETTTGNFSLLGVAARPLDIVATRGVVSFDDFMTPDKMIVRRSQDLSSTIPTLDFAAAEAFSPVTSNLTVAGFTNGHAIEFSNTLWTPTATYGTVSSGTVPGGGTTIWSVPASQLVAGDVHEFVVDAFQSDGLVGHANISYFTTPADRVEQLGPLLSQPAVSIVAASPYGRMRGQLPSQAAYGTAAQFQFLQGGSTTRKFLALVATAAYLGALPATWDIVTPDLTGAAAFDNSWMPVAGQSTSYLAQAFAGREEALFGAIPNPGETIKQAYRITLGVLLLRAPATEVRRSRGPIFTQYLRR